MERCQPLPRAGDGDDGHARGELLASHRRPMASRTLDSERRARNRPDRPTRRRLASGQLPRAVAPAANRHPSDNAREIRRVLSDRAKKKVGIKEAASCCRRAAAADIVVLFP
jgi:hypothetical protein